MQYIYITCSQADEEYLQDVIGNYKYDDDTPMYQLEHHKRKNDSKVDIIAPKCKSRIVSKDAHETDYKSGPVSSETKFNINVSWLKNPKFIHKRVWKIITESEGFSDRNKLNFSYTKNKINLNLGDPFQKDVAKKSCENKGSLSIGAGGTGKSYTLELIVKMKIEQEYIVHIIAFTHAAVSNINHCSPNGANTIQHFSPIRLGLKGSLLGSNTTGELSGPARAPGSLGNRPPRVPWASRAWFLAPK